MTGKGEDQGVLWITLEKEKKTRVIGDVRGKKKQVSLGKNPLMKGRREIGVVETTRIASKGSK